MYCGEGTCTNNGTYRYMCSCNPGFSNLLNISYYPCYSQCTLGSDCAEIVRLASSTSGGTGTGTGNGTTPGGNPGEVDEENGSNSSNQNATAGASSRTTSDIRGAGLTPHHSSSVLNLLKVDPRVIKTIVPQTRAANRIRKAVEDAAATRIQAVFRSYLARKALCANGLVKLQVLVPGEETNCCYSSANACTYDNTSNNSCQRAQMARESQISVKSRSSRQRVSSQFLSAVIYKSQIIVLMLTELRAMENSLILKLAYNTLLSGYINHPLIDRIEREVPRFYSGELQISRQDINTRSSASHHRTVPQFSPSRTPGRASFTYETPDYADTLSNQFSILQTTWLTQNLPRLNSGHRVNRNSSLNKASEFKTSKHSMDGLLVQKDAQSQCSSSHSKHIAHENQDPWFINSINQQVKR
ncbi:protein IQ-DOMAIN 14 [Populus alba x Populus x berolinensis]|uniref:Protein IQ-DOMAIN 14 n=1 Tax=Populus alba x Populus x berolinensis TaxID=444605 RepID=A0AAD6QTQ1_9ROSI|nr:protein IQ-DOMAIN 14 [Populus alba x Populus x berolinensis]